MNRSESIVNLAVALAKAQAKMPVALFDKENPFMHSKYATLGAVISASRPVLAAEGLSITQFPVSQEGRIGVTSILMHESGEYIENTITIVPEAKGATAAQAAGIAITYLRRYSWAAICGMYADEDSDGENEAVQQAVTKIMSSGKSVDTATGEIVSDRTWSFAQMDTLIDAGQATDYEAAKAILDLSVLPEDAPVKTVESWMKHFCKAEGGRVAQAQVANEAYIKAKSGGKK